MNQLDELRQIIVGDNAQQLAQLRERLESVEARTRDVSEVLAPAIDATMARDDSLVSALKEPVSEGLKQAIRVEPQAYAEILYPAIAPSIRAAIAQAINSMLATINKTIESATTVGGIRTRIEAVRTGVPYGELLLRRSLLYRVEHIYLIDRESGLLIGEMAGEGGSQLDSDAVSAMFSAIQSFVQDSFSAAPEDRLTDFKVGQHNIWIAHGPRAMLACVIRGEAPESLKTQLHTTLEQIRLEYGDALAKFDGDASQFAELPGYISPLLQMRLRAESEQPKQRSASLGPWLVYAAVLGLFCYWAYHSIERYRAVSAARHYLDATPGVVVTDVYWEDGKVQVEGLRDSAAELPLSTLRAYGIAEQNISLSLSPFRSLDPQVELQRFAKEFSLPGTAELELDEGGNLFLAGQASLPWLSFHSDRLRQLSAEGRLNLQQLYITQPSLEAYVFQTASKLDRAEQQRRVQADLGTPWIQWVQENRRF